MDKDSEYDWQGAAEIFQQITCNDAWHSNSQSSDCPDCGMERPVAQPPAEALGADEVARRVARRISDKWTTYISDEERHLMTAQIAVALRAAAQRTRREDAEHIKRKGEEYREQGERWHRQIIENEADFSAPLMREQNYSDRDQCFAKQAACTALATDILARLGGPESKRQTPERKQP